MFSIFYFVFSDNSFTSSDSTIYEFNMPALTSLLRKQFEQNPVASYFNVDILKYQVSYINVIIIDQTFYNFLLHFLGKIAQYCSRFMSVPISFILQMQQYLYGS